MNVYEYETICVMAPDMTAEEIKAIDDKVAKIFASFKVTEVNRKDWGNKRLAYSINDYKTANYVQFNHNSPAALVAELERNLGYEEKVLRYLTTRRDPRYANRAELMKLAEARAKNRKQEIGSEED